MPTVWLIRHGVSQSNAGELTFNPNFTGLTRLGKEQAEYIAKAFSQAPSLIITSKYIRTQQTAFPTIKRFQTAKHEQWGDIHEFTYLSCAHSSRMTLEQRRPMVETYWRRNDPLYNDGEGAESFVRFISRASGVVERLRYSQENFIAVFTHGYFMRAVWWLLHANLNKIDPASMREFHDLLEKLPVPNGAILPLELSHSGQFWAGDVFVSHPLHMREGEQSKRSRLLEGFGASLTEKAKAIAY